MPKNTKASCKPKIPITKVAKFPSTNLPMPKPSKRKPAAIPGLLVNNLFTPEMTELYERPRPKPETPQKIQNRRDIYIPNRMVITNPAKINMAENQTIFLQVVFIMSFPETNPPIQKNIIVVYVIKLCMMFTPRYCDTIFAP